jgi:vitamin B12 transporter
MKKKFLAIFLTSFLGANNLPDVQIVKYVDTPYGVTHSLKQTTSNVDVLTKDDLEKFDSVVDAIGSLSSISISSNGALGQSVSFYLRGFNTKRTLVLINGIRLNDPTSLSGASLEHINLDDVERIEVQKGALSGVWGADASAGVINIITKKPKKQISAKLGLYKGSFNTTKKTLNSFIQHEKFDFGFNFMDLKSDGFSSITPFGDNPKDYEKDGYENTTTNINLGLNLSYMDKLKLSYTNIDTFTNSDPLGDPNGVYDVHSKTELTSVVYDHIDSFNNFKMHYNSTDISRYYPQASFGSPNFDGKTSSFGAKSKIPYKNDHFVLVGFDTKKFEHFNSLDKKYGSNGYFITNASSFNDDRTILTASARYDDYDKFSNKTTFKLGAKQHIKQNLYMSVNYSTGYNVPTIFHLYDSTYGNENLNPEDIKSFETSLEYKNFKATYFYNTIESMIDYYDPDGWLGPIPGSYDNVAGKSKIKGFELSNKFLITPFTSLNVAYTTLDAKKQDGTVLPKRAKSKLVANLSYYKNKLKLSLNAKYIGSRVDSSNNQTGKYTVFDAYISKKITKSLNLKLKVNNLTNKYYQTTYGYTTAKRSAHLGLEAKF